MLHIIRHYNMGGAVMLHIIRHYNMGGAVMLHIIRHERGDCDASHYQTLQHEGGL